MGLQGNNSGFEKVATPIETRYFGLPPANLTLAEKLDIMKRQIEERRATLAAWDNERLAQGYTSALPGE